MNKWIFRIGIVGIILTTLFVILVIVTDQPGQRPFWIPESALSKPTPTPEKAPIATAGRSTTLLGDMLELGYRRFDIYVWHEETRPDVESYIAWSAKGFPDADIRIIVSEETVPYNVFSANGRYMFRYGK